VRNHIVNNIAGREDLIIFSFNIISVENVPTLFFLYDLFEKFDNLLYRDDFRSFDSTKRIFEMTLIEFELKIIH
jgi:hypothetical protein